MYVYNSNVVCVAATRKRLETFDLIPGMRRKVYELYIVIFIYGRSFTF